MTVLIAAPDVFTIVEGILGWIEPDPGITKDDALARPPSYQVDTLYLYVDDEDYVGFESGPSQRQNFRLVLDLALDNEGESGYRLREVTDALRMRSSAYIERVADNARTLTHDHLRVARVEWNVLDGQHFRGFRMRLEGYRLLGGY